MDKQPFVIAAAFAIALFMAYKPEMCIPNPKHRTPIFTRAIRNVGISVAVVLLVWLIITIAR